MLKRIVVGIAIAVIVIAAGLMVVIATQPEDFKVTRMTTMKAPPEKVFGLVNDFHKWDAWSPWAKLDPNMKTTLSGPESGAGAVYSWIGNDEVGEGKMTIAESHPTQHVKIDLEFIAPFAQKSVTDFTFKPDGGVTEVTWTMNGKHNFISKAFCLVMNMDKMVGGDFEKGLSQMKAVAETPALDRADYPGRYLMNIILWIVQVLLALLFLMSGVIKFVMSYADMTKDAPVVLPYWFILFIGVCEILGGIGLVVPWLTGIKPGLTPLAAALLVIIMIGAVVTTLPGGIAMAIVPAVVGLLCIFVAWGRRRGVKE